MIRLGIRMQVRPAFRCGLNWIGVDCQPISDVLQVVVPSWQRAAQKFRDSGGNKPLPQKLLFWCDHLSGRLSRYGALPPCGSQSSVRRLPACHFGNGALPLSVSSTLECPLAVLSGTAQQSTGLPRGQALSASGGQLRQRRSQFQVRLRGPALCLLMALQRNIN